MICSPGAFGTRVQALSPDVLFQCMAWSRGEANC